MSNLESAQKPYIVLARKYRPHVFDDVVGQEHITRTLQNAIEQDRVAHALLFVGSRGVGKTTCARILACALNCEHGPTIEPCGECSACLEIQNGTSVDVIEIDGASNNSVDQIRDIRESVKLLPSRGKRKMYIIDEVHMLSTSAFNALLKTLEEPPLHVIFVFATTEPHKIPETILSRCQRFDFKRITETKIVGRLQAIAQKEGIQIEEAALAHIAREAKGGMRDSLSLLDQVIAFCGTTISEERTREVLGIADLRVLGDLARAILSSNGQAALEIVSELFRAGLDLQKFAGELVAYFRDLMIIKLCPDPKKLLDLTDGELAARSELCGRQSAGSLHRALNALLKGAEEISRSSYPKLVLEMTLLRLCMQGPTQSLGQVLEGLTRLEQRLGASESQGTNQDAVQAGRSVPFVETPPAPSGARVEGPSLHAKPPVFSPSQAVKQISSSPANVNVTSAVSTQNSAVVQVAPRAINDRQQVPMPPAHSPLAPQVAPVAPAAPQTAPESSKAVPSAQIVQSASQKTSEFPFGQLEPIALFEHFLQLLKPRDQFLAAELEQNAYLVQFDAQLLSLAIAPIAVEKLRENQAKLGAFLKESLPECTLKMHYCNSDQDSQMAGETVFDRSKRLAQEERIQRQEMAQRDPAVLQFMAEFGAELLDVNPL